MDLQIKFVHTERGKKSEVLPSPNRNVRKDYHYFIS